VRYVLIMTALFLGLAAPQVPAAEARTITLTVGKAKLVAEVVDTPDTRATGLMHRFSLQPDHGMLFVFDRPQPLGFWMKNIDDMRPQDESTHWSKGLALYAIEMRQGWFATKGIVAGEKVTGLPAASAN